jgi:hypothetical protein
MTRHDSLKQEFNPNNIKKFRSYLAGSTLLSIAKASWLRLCGEK